MISFRSFSKTFGPHRAVVDLTLDAASGEVLALLGPNGSGKTTCLKAAAGLIHPTKGEVLLGDPGCPATDPTSRSAISYLPQRVGFPETLTAREVLEFYRALRAAPEPRTNEVLKFASLNGASGRAVGTYSGGMLQRLGLAVALLPDAPVLLLDEPTAALDPDGLCAFYGVVSEARGRGRAVVFSSHQLGDVEHLADRFAILVEGRLIACLSADELKRRLEDRGVMRLRLESAPPELLARVREIAPLATWAKTELVVPGPTALRPAVLECARAAGAVVKGLSADDGRLDGLYRELVAESAEGR